MIEIQSNISLPCLGYVQTVYELRFHDGLPSLFTKELFDLYAHGLAATAAATSGYNITVVPGSGKFTGNRYSMTLSEPTAGSIADFLCTFYQSGTYKKGHYACYIKDVYADKKAYCRKMDLCAVTGSADSESNGDNGKKDDSGCGERSPVMSFVVMVVVAAMLVAVL